MLPSLGASSGLWKAARHLRLPGAILPHPHPLHSTVTSGFHTPRKWWRERENLELQREQGSLLHLLELCDFCPCLGPVGSGHAGSVRTVTPTLQPLSPHLVCLSLTPLHCLPGAKVISTLSACGCQTCRPSPRLSLSGSHSCLHVSPWAASQLLKFNTPPDTWTHSHLCWICQKAVTAGA